MSRRWQCLRDGRWLWARVDFCLFSVDFPLLPVTMLRFFSLEEPPVSSSSFIWPDRILSLHTSWSGHVTQTWPISTFHPYGSFVIGSVVDTRLLGLWDPNWGCCWKSLETLFFFFFAGVIGNQNDVRMEGLRGGAPCGRVPLKSRTKELTKEKGRTEVLWFLFECQDSYISADRFAPGVFRSLRQYIPFPFLLV